MSDAELIGTHVVGNLYTNCYFLASDDSLLVIDPGGDPEELSKLIQDSGYGEVNLVATHCHFDHILAAAQLQEDLNCKLYIDRRERDYLKESVKLSEELFGTSFELPQCTFFTGQSDFPLPLKVIETPGHTPGSCIFLSGDKMFTGDTLFRDSIGRTDFFGSDEKMKESLNFLYNMQDEFTVFPGHGSKTTLSREKNENAIFRIYAGIKP